MKPPATGMSPRRWQVATRQRWWVGVLVVAVAVGTTAIYYQSFFAPRERAGVASPELAALLAADSPFERVLWLASPHQNLGALDERVGDLELYLAELSRLTGVARPRLPRFGPFALPPAREIVMAWNGSGETFLGVARIEPGVAWLARLSGRIAGNPWLAGGRVAASGRTFEVRWQGALWIVASGVPPRVDPLLGNRPPENAQVEAQPAVIAQLKLATELGPLPTGRFTLARGADGLEVRSGLLPEALQAASEWSFPGIALWMSSADRGPLGGPGLFLLWEAAEGAIPRVAVLQRGGGRSFKLPGEAILELVGAGEPSYRLGWSVRGTQKSARREALLLVPWFERHLPRPGGRGAWLGRAGRLVPAGSARTLGLLVRNLEKLPLIPPAEVQRIAAAAGLLVPFQGCAAITFEVWHEPEGVRVKLCSQIAGPEPEREALSPSEDGEIDEGAPIR
ncbi:MAG: hypothetical protein QG573_845 [Acidobacteriota bacterium]|nr:hypothetical protein [Acidobacteriota bacterium]